MDFQMEAQPDRLHSQNENRGEVDVSQRELLMEAFGSMNLGARTEDAARYGPLTTTQFNSFGHFTKGLRQSLLMVSWDLSA